jgi:acyl-CoA dehydrogenase
MTAAIDDGLLDGVLHRIFGELSLPPAPVDEPTGEGGWNAPLWEALAAAGIPWISINESSGGSGGALSDLAVALRLVGYYGAAVPLAETSLLGGWLLDQAGLPIPSGPLAVVAARREGSTVDMGGQANTWRISMSARHVAFARNAERIVALVPSDAGYLVCSIPSAAATITHHRNLAGEPRDEVILSDVRLSGGDVAPAPDARVAEHLHRRAAAALVVMMSGAIDRVEELTVGYAAERVQFGRPIAGFQAVQQRLALIAEGSLKARMAAALAITGLAAGGVSPVIPAAKVVVSEAASDVAAHAHQVHGAIGMTAEYLLNRFTRRLWSWRHEGGSAAEWSRAIGDAALRAPDGVWQFITTDLVDPST